MLYVFLFVEDMNLFTYVICDIKEDEEDEKKEINFNNWYSFFVL